MGNAISTHWYEIVIVATMAGNTIATLANAFVTFATIRLRR